MAKTKAYYQIKRSNKGYNVYLKWGWQTRFVHWFDSYEAARECGRNWAKTIA